MNYQDLINRIKQSDNSAIMEFYNKFYKEVYYVCYKITENEKDAEDVAQETLIKAIDKIDTLKNPEGLSAWLRTIANNLSINYLKKNRKFDIVDNSEDMGEEIFEENRIAKKTPEDIVADKEVTDILTNMINRLPREQRITIFMFYYEELSVKEIAEIMDCSEATVRSRINYARKALRKQVDELENKGVKLRCIAILPFLFAIYSFEKTGVCASIAMPSAGVLSGGVKGSAESLVKAGKVAGEAAKMSLKAKIAIGAVAAVVFIAGVIGVVSFVGNSNDGSISGDVSADFEKKQEDFKGLESVETEPTYEMKFAGRWGDMDLGVSYLVPRQETSSDSYEKKNATQIFYNGAVHMINNGDNLAVTMGTDDPNNMFTGFTYLIGSEFGNLGCAIEEIIVTNSEEVRLGDYKAIHYQATVGSIGIMEGYMVYFNDKKILISAIHDNTSYADMAESVEYAVQVALSLEEYDGRAICDIENNDVDVSSFIRYSNEVTIGTHLYKVQHPYLNFLWPRKPGFVHYNDDERLQLHIRDEEMIVNAQNPIQAMIDSPLGFSAAEKSEIISSEKVVIAGIEMDKTIVVEYESLAGELFPTYLSVFYGFIDDGKYVYLYDTQEVYDMDILERREYDELPWDKEAWNIEMDRAKKMADKYAGTVIRTLVVQ